MKFEMTETIPQDLTIKIENLRTLRSILLQPFVYYKIDANKRFLQSKFTKNNYIRTKEYILNFY